MDARDGVYYCDEPGCDWFADGRAMPSYDANLHSDKHAVSVHGKRWRPFVPQMAKLIAVIPSATRSIHAAVDEYGEWWGWKDGAWRWLPYGLSETDG